MNRVTTNGLRNEMSGSHGRHRRSNIEYHCLLPTEHTRPLWMLVGWLLIGFSSGCASLTFPVSGIPAHRVPPALLGESKEDQEIIDLALLTQPPPEVYRLAPGDVLGIWIEGILGTPDQAPPVQILEEFDLPPAIGFPVPVREDGSVTLPLVDPVSVQGLSITEAQEAIRRAYVTPKQVLPPDKPVIVTLMRPRTHHVLVIREDSAEGTVTEAGAFGATVTSARRGTGNAVDLPAYRNDVLNALAQTGGLPGRDAANEVIIMRGIFKGPRDREAIQREIVLLPPDSAKAALRRADTSKIIRIPLRLRPDEKPTFKPGDVVLHTGDVLYIEARDAEVFYTGGLLPPAQFPLPRDYDLDVLEAIAVIGGPIASGGISTGGFNLTRGLVGSGIGAPSPSLVIVLRQVPGGGQVPIRVDLNRALRDPRERILIQPGDFIIMQETPGEALARYMSAAFTFAADWQIWSRGESSGISNVTLP